MIKPNIYGYLYLYFIYKALKQQYNNIKAHKKTDIAASKYIKRLYKDFYNDSCCDFKKIFATL